MTLSFTRIQAIDLMNEHTANPGLRKHCLAVGMAMRGLAEHFHTQKDLWEVVGILHDADWELTKDRPHEHTALTIGWLKEMGCENNAVTEAILAHAHHVNGFHRGPVGQLEWSLYCCDELTGLIVANALIMPSRKLADVTVESVIKKMGSKSFASGVDRESIRMCERELGMPLHNFVSCVLFAMQKRAHEIGL